MITLALIAAWIWENIPHWLLFLIPVAMLVADVGHFNKKWFPQKDDYQAQITKASHGAAFVILAPMITNFILHDPLSYYLPREWIPFIWPITFGIMALGGWWLVVGWARTMVNRRDMNLITRALVKFALGVALLFALFHTMLPEFSWPQPYRGYANVAVWFLGLWLCITAVVRFALLMKKMRTMESMHPAPQGKRFGAGWKWE